MEGRAPNKSLLPLYILLDSCVHNQNVCSLLSETRTYKLLGFVTVSSLQNNMCNKKSADVVEAEKVGVHLEGILAGMT